MLVGRLGYTVYRGFVMGRETAKPEGGAVHVDGRAVEHDRLLDGGRTDRHVAKLISVAEQENIGRDRVAEQLHRIVVGVQRVQRPFAYAVGDGLQQLVSGYDQLRIARETTRDHLVGGYGAGGPSWPDGFEALGRCRDDELAAEHEVGIGDADANGVNLVSRARHAHVTGHRAALLRETRHVD